MVLSFFGQNGGSGKGGGSGQNGDGPPPPELAELRAYWQALRQSGAVPARASINPRGIAGVLEKTVLIERVAPGIARLRIAGMAVRELMGCEVTGMPLSALFEPAARTALAEALEALFARPSTLEMAVAADRGIGRPALLGRMLLLPLQGSDGVVDMAIGCLCLSGSPGRAPRRLALRAVTQEPLLMATGRPRQVELAEAPAPFTAKGRGAERPYLRLVKSD